MAAGWILPGLVDCHCHSACAGRRRADEAEAVEQAVADRDAGALLLRDAGSPVTTGACSGRDDLPAADPGRPAHRPAEALPARPRRRGRAGRARRGGRGARPRRGDGWVKLVGDWIDREVGDLAPLWPDDVLAAAIARAHELGARVAAHVFGEDALPG